MGNPERRDELADGALPSFTDELEDAEGLLRPYRSSALAPADRRFLLGVVRELTVALASLDAERRPLHGSPHTANWFPDRGRPSAARLRDRAPRARRMGPSRPRRGGTRLLSRRRPRRDYHPCAECAARASPPSAGSGPNEHQSSATPRTSISNCSAGRSWTDRENRRHTCRPCSRGGRSSDESRSESDEPLGAGSLPIRGALCTWSPRGAQTSTGEGWTTRETSASRARND